MKLKFLNEGQLALIGDDIIIISPGRKTSKQYMRPIAEKPQGVAGLVVIILGKKTGGSLVLNHFPLDMRHERHDTEVIPLKLTEDPHFD